MKFAAASRMSTPLPNLHVLSWDRPLLHSVVDWLAREWDASGPLDLSDMLLVAPTRQAGRRLREALAAYAAGRGQAVFPPRVVMPESLASLDAPASGVASRSESLLAWAEVLRSVSLDTFREVFPVDPPQRGFAWAARLAREFQRLQTTLAENGLRMGDVARRAGEDFPEAERWRQLGALEARYDGVLAKRGLRDAQAVKIETATRPHLPENIRRIVVAGTPDPLPLAMRVLALFAQQAPVDVLVTGPADEEAHTLFDEWGRPRADVWGTRVFQFDDFERHVRLLPDPAAQAEAIVSCASEYKTPGGRLGVGVADAEILPSLENGLARAEVPAFNPEGRPYRREALHTLLGALAEFASEASFVATATLMRCPDVLRWLGGDAARLLAALDELREAHLPATLAAARAHARKSERWASLSHALDRLHRLRATLTDGAFFACVREALIEIFRERRFNLATPDDARAVEAAQAWAEVLVELEAAAERFPGLAANEWWELALRAFGDSQRFDDKPEGAVELQGWLELLWDDAPHLIVAGLNDGRVPDAVVGDAFLPETLRGRLGLKTNAARFARDAYLLQALAAFRAEGRGRLDLLFGKTSGAGDPLRPSRLLLLCDDAELPDRVAFLFRALDQRRPNPAWRRAWKLVPRVDAKIERLSVTSFRDYLKCPFRFYLKRGLRMDAVDPHKAELDAMDFGNLCHAALEAMGRPDSPMRDCTDADTLRRFLLEEFERAAREIYGDTPVLPLVVQLESARQRLSKLAEVQARERAEGWVIQRTEQTFDLEIDGMVVRGKIDRIDRNELTGQVRVLDYKTSDKPVTPREAHVRNQKRTETDESLPDFARFLDGDKAQVWVDLQLPLYLEALAGEFGRELVCGYFNLPKAASETGVSLWTEYNPALHAEAMRCAKGVIDAVKARRFWPPAELPAEWDEFAALFTQGAEDSVEWKGELSA